MITLHLKRDRHKKIEQGHLWAFAGDVNEDISKIEPGTRIALCESRGELLGRGYVNPRSLISVRLLTVGDENWDDGLITRRIQKAFEFRQKMCSGWEAYRLVFAESDLLPGLIADRFGDHVIIQPVTAGMEKLLDEVVDGLKEVVKPESIYLRGDVLHRKLEGLPLENRQLYGKTPEEILFDEAGVTLGSRPIKGQKTGFFLDQRSNRDMVMGMVEGKRVLDLYCYTGAWGIRALKRGAKEAVFVDSSEPAVNWAMEDAGRNGLTKRAVFTRADVGDFLQSIIDSGEKFDLVVLDPPAFIKARSKSVQGLKAYKIANKLAMQVVKQGGVLVSCSCSHLLDRHRHLSMIGEAAQLLKRKVKLINSGGQPVDHHIRPGHPETEYLKCFIVEVD